MAEQQVIFDRTKTPFDGRLLVLNSGQINFLLENHKRIGQTGNFSDVFISQQPFDVLDRKLVVKKRRKTMQVDGNAIPRASERSDFRNEIFAARLRHFAIVPVIGIHIGETETVFISVALERDLWSVVFKEDGLRKTEEQIGLTTRQRVSILYQIAAALHYLHTRVDGIKPAIAHGDITARNVVLDKNNNARLIDFGSCQRCIGDNDPAFAEDFKQFGKVITDLTTESNSNSTYKKLRKLADRLGDNVITMRDFMDKIKELHYDYFVQDESDPRCQVCLLLEADTVPFEHHGCAGRPKICIACLQSTYMNPVICPECLKPVEVPLLLLGANYGGILIAGNHVDEKCSNKHYKDVKDMAKIITPVHHSSTTHRGSTVRTIYPKRLRGGKQKIKSVVNVLMTNARNGMSAIEQTEKMLETMDDHGNEPHLQSLKDAMYEHARGLDRIQDDIRGHHTIASQIERAFSDMKRFGVKSLLVFFSGEFCSSRGFQLSDASDYLATDRLKELIKTVGNMDEMKSITIMFDCCYAPEVYSVLGGSSGPRFIQINCCANDVSQPIDDKLKNSVFTEYVKQILDKSSLKSSDSTCLIQRKFGKTNCVICKDQRNLDMTKKYTTADELFNYIDRHMENHFKLSKESCEAKYMPVKTFMKLTRTSDNVVHNSHFTYEFPVILHREGKESITFDIHEILDVLPLKSVFGVIFDYYQVNFNIEMSIPDREQLRLFRLTTVVGDEEIKTKERLLTAFVHKELIQFGFQEYACITKGPIAVIDSEDKKVPGSLKSCLDQSEDRIVRLDKFESEVGVPGSLKSCLDQFDQTMYVRIQSGTITEDQRDRKMVVYELLQPTNAVSTLMCC